MTHETEPESTGGYEPLGLNEYQRQARKTDQNAVEGLEGIAFPLLGLFGEVGTLLSSLKKRQRDRESYIEYTHAVIEEFGDVLWYFSNVTSRAGLDLRVLAQRTFRDLTDWDEVGSDEFGTFAEIQTARQQGGSPESQEFQEALLALAGKVGLLLNDVHLGRVAKNRDVLSAHLVDVLRSIVAAADVANVSLGEAARRNIQKIDDRWPVERIYAPLFDDDYGPLEQFPRYLEIHIFEEKVNYKTYVFQQCNGINLGSRLTDNRIKQDDYRFHDVFHWANVAVLGWSPVMRALLKLKRKSQPKIDEAQDGARAILIEEGLSTLIFHRACLLKHFEGLNSLDYSLLKLIPQFVAGYEVEKCPLWQWEQAILDGYAVFRQFQSHRRGKVCVDMNARSISFVDLA